VLDEQPSVVDGPLAVDLVDVQGRWSPSRTSTSSPTQPDSPLILDTLNLRLQPGESVAMVGRTAAARRPSRELTVALLRRHLAAP